jgi:hypothetical protein
VWEAQRGGPRRKRKATVAVPPRAKPRNVDQSMNMKPAARNEPALAAEMRGSHMPSEVSQADATVASLPYASFPMQPSINRETLLQQASRRDALGPLASWNLLNFGGYQQTVPNRLIPAPLIPMATNLSYAINPPMDSLQNRLNQLPPSLYLNQLQSLQFARPTVAEQEERLRLQLLQSLGAFGNLQSPATLLGDFSHGYRAQNVTLGHPPALQAPASSNSGGNNDDESTKSDSS